MSLLLLIKLFVVLFVSSYSHLHFNYFSSVDQVRVHFPTSVGCIVIVICKRQTAKCVFNADEAVEQREVKRKGIDTKHISNVILINRKKKTHLPYILWNAWNIHIIQVIWTSIHLSPPSFLSFMTAWQCWNFPIGYYTNKVIIVLLLISTVIIPLGINWYLVQCVIP